MVKKPCAQTGCSELVPVGQTYCDKHAKPRQDRRVSRHERGYDSKWDRFSKWYKRRHPICALCTRPTALPHHIKPLSEGGSKYDDDNLMPVCRLHHDEVHKRLNHEKKKQAGS